MTTNELKRRIMEVAGYLSVGEELTADECDMPFSKFIEVRIFDWHDSPVQLALLVSILAKHIEEQ